MNLSFFNSLYSPIVKWWNSFFHSRLLFTKKKNKTFPTGSVLFKDIGARPFVSAHGVVLHRYISFLSVPNRPYISHAKAGPENVH